MPGSDKIRNIMDTAVGKNVKCSRVSQDKLEQKQTAEKISRQNEYLTSLHETSIGLLNNLDLDDLLKSIVVRASELFKTSDAYLCLLDESRGVLQIRVSIGRLVQAGYSAGYILQLGEGVAGKVVQTGQSLVIQDYAHWSGRIQGSFWDALQTCAGIPLKLGNKVIGVIGLDFFVEPRSISLEEIEIFSRFAELASVALNNAKLHSALIQSEKALEHKVAELMLKEDKIRQQNVLLTNLHETALGLMQRFDLNEVLKMIVDNFTSLLGTADGFVELESETEGIFTLQISAGLYSNLIGRKVRVIEGILGEVYSSGQIVAIDNYKQWEKRLPDKFFDTVQCFVMAPLKSGNKVVGTLGLTYSEPNRKFTAQEIVLLQRFADIASIAIDNAKLYASMQEELIQRKMAQQALASSEEKFSKAFRRVADVVGIVRLKDGCYIDVNDAFSNILGYSRKEIIGRTSREIGLWCNEEDYVKMFQLLKQEGAVHELELAWRAKSGEIRVGVDSAELIEVGGECWIVYAWHDITERKQAEEKLRFLSVHDPLTGLYNRAYFMEEMERFQAEQDLSAVIMCDIDGLKLINDTLGHIAGDQVLIAAAKIIRGGIRPGDVPARIGGDEFAIFLHGADEKMAQRILQKMRSQLAVYNQQNPTIPVSLSLGYSVKDAPASLQDIVKEADNYMYREKLLHSQSAHSDIVKTVMKLLEERDFETEEHAERLQKLVYRLATKLKFPESRIANIQIFAKFHDIGKIGIPDHIMRKPGPLNEEEKQEMRRHCEIGYRIAKSSADLLPIATWVLKHQEWWNGQGYPLGIKGQEIPVECRILAIADAYDAMTSNRPYRKAMSHKAAIEELKRCAGTQFDPEIVKIFIAMNLK